MLCELNEGDLFADTLAGVGRAQYKTSKSGSGYIDIELSDKGGSVNAKMWDAPQEVFERIVEGGAVKISGRVVLWNGVTQLVLTSIEPCENPVDVLELMPEPPAGIKIADLEVKLKNVIKHSLLEQDRDIISQIFATGGQYQFYINAPAAQRVHHAYRHGLLIHSLNVMELCFAAVNKTWTNPNVDNSLLLLAALLHDIGKIYELSWGVATRYTSVGQLLGHHTIGSRIIRSACNKCKIPEERIMKLEHCILSHHGKYEYGASTEPKTAEAYILHCADMLDSKMEIVRAAQEKATSGWSDPVYALKTALYFGEGDE